MRGIILRAASFLFFLVPLLTSVSAQPTAFGYQGRLSQAGVPSEGTFDFEFRLFDTASPGGAPIGVQTRPGVLVTQGVFSVTLDFGAAAFPGADRWLEIVVGPAGGGPTVVLSPRIALASAPYSIRSLTATDATQLNGTAASQYVQTNDPRLTDARPPAPGSGDYIQNQTGAPQVGAGFSIAGNGTIGGTLSATNVGIGTSTPAARLDVQGEDALGNTTARIHSSLNTAILSLDSTIGGQNQVWNLENGVNGTPGLFSIFDRTAFQSRLTIDTTGKVSVPGNLDVGQTLTANTLSMNIVNAASHFSIGGNRVLSATSAGLGNTTVGISAGLSITSGTDNTFLGFRAGVSNSQGTSNSFIGSESGLSNSTGSGNTFTGTASGRLNGAGSNNSFYGIRAGFANTTGNDNTFVGADAGQSNGGGNGNSFFGRNAGRVNTASFNSFFGSGAGEANSTGIGNTYVGSSAGLGNTAGVNNVFIGQAAGSISTGSSNVFVGVRAGLRSTGVFNSFFGEEAGISNLGGSRNSFMGNGSGANNSTGNNNAFFGNFAGLTNTIGSNNTLIGAGANVSANHLAFATAIGSNALAFTSDSITLGKIGGTYDGLVRPADSVIIPGSLGIGGVLMPQAKLFVSGGTSWFQGDSTPFPSFAGKGVAVGFGGEQGYVFAFDYASSTPRNLLFNGQGGNVGIGMSTPNSKLTVAGMIETTTGGVKFPDGTIQTTAGGGTSGVTSLNGLTGGVTLAAGSNIAITPSGNTLTIASTGGGGGILNQTTLQTGANFNIDGTGKANIVEATAQYNIGGNRFAAAPPTSGSTIVGFTNGSGNANSFFGFQAGDHTVFPANSNSFFGFNAGQFNTTGNLNSFFGHTAGFRNTAPGNSFFGALAGSQNTTGIQNSYFGLAAGGNNATGSRNSFFGHDAGAGFSDGASGNSFFGSGTGVNNRGNNNAFFGWDAGRMNQTGSGNTFVGTSAGKNNVTGNDNTLLGTDAALGIDGLSNASAMGARAQVDRANSVVLGSIANINGATNDTNIGIGTSAPLSKLHVRQGDIYIDSPAALFGLVIKSPNGSCWRITAGDTGTLATVSIACP